MLSALRLRRVRRRRMADARHRARRSARVLGCSTRVLALKSPQIESPQIESPQIESPQIESP